MASSFWSFDSPKVMPSILGPLPAAASAPKPLQLLRKHLHRIASSGFAFWVICFTGFNELNMVVLLVCLTGFTVLFGFCHVSAGLWTRTFFHSVASYANARRVATHE